MHVCLLALRGMNVYAASLLISVPVVALAQNPVSLPSMTVYSTRVANQSPAVTFAMPVSTLRFEPLVDVQARNLAEGQADVTLRGGIFENTAFQVGGVTLSDPQTGHYLAELPVAPAMLLTPEIRTGADLALGATNATVGAVAFAWRPVQTGGTLGIALGQDRLKRGEIYQGYSAASSPGASKYGMDVALAHSEADGSVPFGEHEFDRVNVRLQRSRADSQTDLFGGYQHKRFGWPNLYTPFNSNETENLETTLFALNHRSSFGAGQFVEAGAYHRRNKDDYAFNRFAPLGVVHPFQHTTWISGAAVSGRGNWEEFSLGARAEVFADEIKSTSLTFGRFHTRTVSKVAVVPERTWTESDGTRTTLKVGVSAEDSNHDGGSCSPIVSAVREFPGAPWHRIDFSYAKTSQVPTYTALNSNATAGLFRGNPNLGRETSHAFEVGSAATINGWKARGAIFWRRDKALVDWTFRRGVTARTANAVDVDVTGAELVVRRSWSTCDVIVGYTALTKDPNYRGAAVDASFYALNYARHRLTAALIARLGDGFELRVDNVARVQAANLLRTVGGDDALTTSVGLSYRPLGWKRVEFSLCADNLWNSRFQDVPSVPAARRQISFGTAIGW